MVLYTSYSEKFKKLSDEQIGKLARLIFAYQLGKEITEITDPAIEIAFEVIKNDLDMNNKKYEEVVKKRTEAGRIGAEKRWHNIANDSKCHQMIANDSKSKQSIANIARIAVSDSVSVSDMNINKSKTRTPKHKYGTYQKVMLTDEEHSKLIKEYGEDKATAAIQFLDEYIAEKSYKSKSHYLAIRRWVISALDERKVKKPSNNLGVFGDYKQTSSDSEWEELMDMQFKEING